MISKRTFLMLSQTWVENRHIGGWFISEKMDGMRVLWDGGASRGVPKEQVPWANVEKDERLVNNQVATGLWSRYGNVIHAPDWWLDTLPRCVLDGELYMGRKRHQELMSAVRKITPVTEEWSNVVFCVFDSPPLMCLFKKGEIRDLHYRKLIHEGMSLFFPKDIAVCEEDWPFMTRLEWLQINAPKFMIKQEKLSYLPDTAHLHMLRVCESIVKNGGEGVILKDPYGKYICNRVHSSLKYKPHRDSEGIIVGFVAGKGKYLGMLGSVIVVWHNKEFEISGFTDEERQMHDPDYCIKHPGEVLPGHIKAKRFTRGSRITFKYRELSLDLIPKEAVYLRPHLEV